MRSGVALVSVVLVSGGCASASPAGDAWDAPGPDLELVVAPDGDLDPGDDPGPDADVEDAPEADIPDEGDRPDLDAEVEEDPGVEVEEPADAEVAEDPDAEVVTDPEDEGLGDPGADVEAESEVPPDPDAELGTDPVDDPDPGPGLDDADAEPDPGDDPGADPGDDPGADGDVPPGDVEPDAGPQALCAPWTPEGAKETAFTTTLGKPDLVTGFLQPTDGDPIEIVQGTQGGVHLEIAFQVALPATYQKCTPNAEGGPPSCKAQVRAEAWSYQTCCGEKNVGHIISTKHLVVSKDGTLTSGTLPVIFDEKSASVYENKLCCVTLQVGAYKPLSETSYEKEPSIWSLTQHTFYCQDFF